MADKNAYCYDLEDPAPKAIYSGHQDVIRGIGFLGECGRYVTCSWDRSIRLWATPADIAAHIAKGQAGAAGGTEVSLLDDDGAEAEEHFVSSYEKEHPLEVPKALLEQHQWALLKAIGVIEEDKGKGRRGAKFRNGAGGGGAGGDGDDDGGDVPGTLGAALERMGEELLQEINSISRTGGGGAGGGGNRAGSAGSGHGSPAGTPNGTGGRPGGSPARGTSRAGTKGSTAGASAATNKASALKPPARP
ncbi:hypothetical protein FOA52_010444 [Chlamydomonas sp. UWO 241]|nr:hypothetical protein FOA52_010444 [Chlamydomonas sp. UWO 241]